MPYTQDLECVKECSENYELLNNECILLDIN